MRKSQTRLRFRIDGCLIFSPMCKPRKTKRCFKFEDCNEASASTVITAIYHPMYRILITSFLHCYSRTFLSHTRARVHALYSSCCGYYNFGKQIVVNKCHLPLTLIYWYNTIFPFC
ncbi:hypothetical protein CEXT_637971 [Caerostris extrusa]|uniref:Uncharacterized protein n=1 Tax=Caerostris extrusa TaxID=172846 RepID=A0AAV4TQP1_CAEEX|nr:hypothetical protein CEXT_637971 [Caerostris extrusa]